MTTEKIKAAVCVGFRPIDSAGGEERRRMLKTVADSMLRGFEHVEIASDDGSGDEPFNRSRAKNHAAAAAADNYDNDPDGVIVFADADTYAPHHQVASAVNGVLANGADLVFAHDGTGLFLSQGRLRGMGQGGIAGPFPGGIFAIRRQAFEAMGGWDEKFVGWGHEDLCFLNSLERIFGLRAAIFNHESIGPFYKLDMLHQRATHETEIRTDPEHPERELYERNTRRRNAYLTLPDRDQEAYWVLRQSETR